MARLGEIDRSEHVRVGYAWRDNRLVAEEVDWKVPSWSRDGDGPHSVAAMIAFGAASLSAEARSWAHSRATALPAWRLCATA